MAVNPLVFPVVPFIGTPVSRPTVLNRPHGQPPAIVTTYIDWSLYGASSTNQRVGISVNLIMGATRAPLDSIRSVYIDNTFSDVPVYVYFADTRFTVLCPPNSIIVQPVITGLQEAIIYAEGFTEIIPVSTVIFTNVEMQPYEVSAAFTLNPLELFLQTQAATSGAGALTKTFNSVNLGDPSTKRVNVFVLSWNSSINVDPKLTGVTFNGAALPIIQSQDADASGALGGCGCAIFYSANLVLPNAQIIASFNVNANVAELSVYRLTRISDNDPIDSGKTGAAAGTNSALSLTLGLPKGSIAIYGASTVPTGVQPTMVNSFIDNVVNMGTNTWHGVSHYQAPIDLSNRAVTNTGSALVGAVWN